MIKLDIKNRLENNYEKGSFRKGKMTKLLKNGEYEYQEKDFIGEGAFAKVYKGVITKT